MITRRVLRTTHFPRIYSQYALYSRPSFLGFPTPIYNPSRLAKSAYTLPHLSTTTTFLRTISTPSKRDPKIDTGLNEADRLEALLKKDNFKTWGFVIYRCTYQDNAEWERFMARFLSAVPEFLQYYSGLDLLDTFAPTVFEDPSFEGATVVTLREHFNKWAKTARKEEQGVSEDYRARTGRYRFFITVDQEALESVLNAPEDFDEKVAFIRMVYAEWEPQEYDEEDIANGDVDPPEEPLEGCTEHDVGWMKMYWRITELPGFGHLRDIDDWQTYYVRSPEIGDIL